MPSSRNRELNPKTLVFAGPTLSGLGDWKASLSKSFVFHPPVRCGNMLEAHDEGFRRVVIVDGFFERYAAVWHKEIMYFMVRGGTCVGCSSMGALRAIELEPFGMLGYGKVVDAFRSDRIADDDEVTVAHLDQSKDFVSLTDAMVNIRITIDEALAREALDPADAEQILKVAKAAFYKKRNLRLFARTVLGEGPKLDRFFAHLDQHGIVDQKRLDAVALLENFDAFLAEQGKPQWRGAEPFNNTVLLQNLQYTVNINPPTLDRQALSPESRVLKLGGLLVGHQYHLLAKLGGALMHYSKHSQARPTPAYKPVSWLDQRWFGDEERISRLVACALEDCPEYADTKEVPPSVRYLAMAIEYPIDYIDVTIAPSHGDSLSSNSTANYSRLLYLLGLFLDARLKIDPLAQKLIPMAKMVELRVAQYTLRGYETDEEQKGFLRNFGLEDLREAATRIERDWMLLTETDMGISFWFFEEGVYWYKLAARVSGLWPQLSSLSKPEVREAFSRELADDLSKQPPSVRLKDLLLAGLPTNLLGADSVLKYINDQLEG
jgi:hypothetical protein